MTTRLSQSVSTTSTISMGVLARCLFCETELVHTFVDLGLSPPCESFVASERLQAMEPFYPLKAFVCHNCFLVQIPVHVDPKEIFQEYAYFSSYSSSWVDHASAYVDRIVPALKLDKQSLVIELASNDGYLLQFFVSREIPVLGVDPAANVAAAAVERGIPTLVEFFGSRLAKDLAEDGRRADLIIANNVLAQVPSISDFLEGARIVLKPSGVMTVEFPHLMRLVEGVQFDTIYHEHYSYFSFITVQRICAAHGLTVFDVEELKTHGGSLRVYLRHTADSSRPVSDRVRKLESREDRLGMRQLAYYTSFAERVQKVKREFLHFLIDAKDQGKSVVGYGAPGKGNTFLNYCGIGTDFIDYTVDRNPYKQGKFLPGTHIPVLPPSKIDETRPDYVFILPWNLSDEIRIQMSRISEWGGRFVVAIPGVHIYE